MINWLIRIFLIIISKIGLKSLYKILYITKTENLINDLSKYLYEHTVLFTNNYCIFKCYDIIFKIYFEKHLPFFPDKYTMFVQDQAFYQNITKILQTIFEYEVLIENSEFETLKRLHINRDSSYIEEYNNPIVRTLITYEFNKKEFLKRAIFGGKL